jgi:hypothetical protein
MFNDSSFHPGNYLKDSIAIGSQAGRNNQKPRSIAIGNRAGESTQDIVSIAIGNFAARRLQGQNSIALGNSAGCNQQRPYSIAIGSEAGRDFQSSFSVAIGYRSGFSTQNTNAIAIGSNSGAFNQGINSIAIGAAAGQTNQPANSIVLNASGSALNGNQTNAFFVDPIRNFSNANVLTYDTTNKEITYVSKTFVIQHPTNPNKYLVHGCLEGPESGVYYRGKAMIPDGSTSTDVKLPEYVPSLATDFTVHVTPTYNGSLRTLNATEVTNGVFTVYGEPGPFTWIVHGSRGTIDAEPEKSAVNVKGDGPYKYI